MQYLIQSHTKKNLSIYFNYIDIIHKSIEWPTHAEWLTNTYKYVQSLLSVTYTLTQSYLF